MNAVRGYGLGPVSPVAKLRRMGRPPTSHHSGRENAMVRKVMVATLALVALATPAYATVVNVGGGTWNYGTTMGSTWSHYQHNQVKHWGTAICGSENKKVIKPAGVWANAEAGCGWFDDKAAYWGKY